MQALRRLQLQLTSYYVGTFTVILLLLAAALFVLLSNQLSAELDVRLESSVAAVRRAMEVREAFGTSPEEALKDAVAETTQPDRPLYLFDQRGAALATPGPVDPRIAASAADAL